EGHDPMAIRLALLSHHYREDWEWFGDEIQVAEERLARWRAATDRSTGPSGAELVDQLRGALTNDLDAPAALKAVDAWASATGDDIEASATVRAAVDALLGVAL